MQTNQDTTADLVRYSQAVGLSKSGRGRPMRGDASLKRIADAVTDRLGRPVAPSTILRWETSQRVPRDAEAAIAWMEVLDALMEGNG
jgi:hypothetical protein